MRIDRGLTLRERREKRRRRERNRFTALVSVLVLLLVFIITDGFGLDLEVTGRAAVESEPPGEAAGMIVSGDEPVASEIEVPEITGIPEITEVPEIIEVPENRKPQTIVSGEVEKTSKDLASLKKDLTAYIKKFKGYYGVYYMDLTDGSSFGINENAGFIAASTIKIPINLLLYQKISEGSINRFGSMTYLKSDYEEGTGKLRYESPGKRYTVKELSKLSIEISDNVAANILLRLLGRSSVKDYMIKLGGKVVDYNRNITSPKDMAIYMKEVYTFSRSNIVLGKELMGFFQNTAFNDRLPLLLPKGTKVAHKIGNQVGACHDVGIVFAKRPYVISVMSRDIRSEKEAFQVIANISKKVFDFVSK